jgi:hypothetical protein
LVSQWRLITASVNGSVAPDRVSSCLPGTAVPILPSPHVSQAAIASARYDSSPPTSGPHFPFVVAPGVYDSPIPDGLALHAMEHGHIVVHYAAGIPPRDLESLRRLAKRYSRDVVLAPYPNLSAPVVLTAWARIDRLTTFDEARVTTFVEKLRGRYDHGWTGPDVCTGASVWSGGRERGEPGRDQRTEDRTAGGDRADRGDDLVAPGRLDQISARAGGQRRDDHLVLL